MRFDQFVIPSLLTEVPLLSERELQVLTGMSFGHTNSQIARKIDLTEDTVKTHARRLFKKLGVGDRAHATRVGLELGLLLPIKPLREPELLALRRPAPQVIMQPIPASWMELVGPEGAQHTAACFAAESCPCRVGAGEVR